MEPGGGLSSPDDQTSVSRGSRAASSWISLNGALLAICAFLPAVRVCDGDPFYPIELPVFAGPNLYGAIAAAVLGSVVLEKTLYRRFATAYVVVGAVAAVYLGVLVHSFAFDIIRSWARSIACTALWWSMAIAHVWAFRRSRPPLWRAARSTWTVAAMCLLLYQWLLQDALYGLWIAVGASSSMLLGAVILEFRAR